VRSVTRGSRPSGGIPNYRRRRRQERNESKARAKRQRGLPACPTGARMKKAARRRPFNLVEDSRKRACDQKKWRMPSSKPFESPPMVGNCPAFDPGSDVGGWVAIGGFCGGFHGGQFRRPVGLEPPDFREFHPRHCERSEAIHGAA